MTLREINSFFRKRIFREVGHVLCMGLLFALFAWFLIVGEISSLNDKDRGGIAGDLFLLICIVGSVATSCLFFYIAVRDLRYPHRSSIVVSIVKYGDLEEVMKHISSDMGADCACFSGGGDKYRIGRQWMMRTGFMRTEFFQLKDVTRVYVGAKSQTINGIRRVSFDIVIQLNPDIILHVPCSDRAEASRVVKVFRTSAPHAGTEDFTIYDLMGYK